MVLEKVVEYFHYWYRNRDRDDVPDMDIPVELCLELLLAADYLGLDSRLIPTPSLDNHAILLTTAFCRSDMNNCSLCVQSNANLAESCAGLPAIRPRCEGVLLHALKVEKADITSSHLGNCYVHQCQPVPVLRDHVQSYGKLLHTETGVMADRISHNV